jgi:predicted porin
MKKSLLALAVLTAVTGAASAQSSVTLYGKIDLGLVLDSGSPKGKSLRIDSGVSGGSRIGFKGVEDLGGGMKAAFQIETGFCADSAANTSGGTPAAQGNFCTGSNSFAGRQAHGDLTGAFGAISAGRQYSLGFNNLSTIDPFGSGFAGMANNVDSKNNYLVDPSGIRLNNSVIYSTPSLGGLIGSAEISFGEQTGNWEANREIGGSVTYASGPAYAGFSFYDKDNAGGNGPALKDYLLGGTYDFGVVKLHALVQKLTGQTVNHMIYMGGVTVPLAGGNVLASYIHNNDRNATNQDASQFGLGYVYPLSKRTSVYTAFAKINNTHGATYFVGNATDQGTGDKAFNLGVVHNF